MKSDPPNKEKKIMKGRVGQRNQYDLCSYLSILNSVNYCKKFIFFNKSSKKSRFSGKIIFIKPLTLG